jgi:hypothetical protein
MTFRLPGRMFGRATGLAGPVLQSLPIHKVQLHRHVTKPHKSLIAGGLSRTIVLSGSGANWTAGSNYSFNATGNEITYGHDQTAYVDADGGAPFSDYLIYKQTIDGSGNHYSVFFEWADVGSVTVSSRIFDASPSITNVWQVFTDVGSTTVYYNSTNKHTFASAATNNESVWLERESDGTVKVYHDEVLEYTFTEKITDDISIGIASGAGTGVHADAVSWEYDA